MRSLLCAQDCCDSFPIQYSSLSFSILRSQTPSSTEKLAIVLGLGLQLFFQCPFVTSVARLAFPLILYILAAPDQQFKQTLYFIQLFCFPRPPLS